jgi:hypothetical protein
MSKPTNQLADLDATRDEVTRALLNPDQDKADEIGRTGPEPAANDKAPHASPREQAAAPINILKVDE